MPLPDKDQYDPVFLHARREAIVILLLFCLFCIWAIAVCLMQGYLKPDEKLATVDTTFGMPTWAFWGIFVPWLVVDVAAVWFCFFFMKADELGPAHEDEDLHEQLEHMKEGAHDD